MMVRWNRRNGVPYSDGSLSLFSPFFLLFLCGTRVDSIFKIHRKLPGRIQRTFSSFILTGLLPVIFQLNAEPYVRKRLGRSGKKRSTCFYQSWWTWKTGRWRLYSVHFLYSRSFKAPSSSSSYRARSRWCNDMQSCGPARTKRVSFFFFFSSGACALFSLSLHLNIHFSL